MNHRFPLLSLLFALLVVRPGVGQQTFVVLDENDVADRPYRTASSGSYDAPDTLALAAEDKLPITYDHAFRGESSGVLRYRHSGGAWSMEILTAASPPSFRGFDSLTVYVNGPRPIAGRHLPRLRLTDRAGQDTRSVWMGQVSNVRIAEAGFSEDSETNIILNPEYVRIVPDDVRRTAYPEDLAITFSDEVEDTSQAGIGLPPVDARFTIETQSGHRPVFRFFDPDGNGTLSRTDEFIEVRFPEVDGSTRLYTTWRFNVAATQGPEPIVPPAAGDVYHLNVAYDEFSLDGDADTWQRVSIPLDKLISESSFDPDAFEKVVFEHSSLADTVRTLWIDLLALEKADDEEFLDMIQEHTFRYFWEEANPSNGLIKDRSTASSPSSIAATGFGLSALTVGIERGWITRAEGRERTLTTLRFFWKAEQSTSSDATGYRGFFYHFLDMETGRRVWQSELSTIDTALLLAGVLHAGTYFDEATESEVEIRALADSIYRRVEFPWMQNRGSSNSAALTHGWRPETGFISHEWLGYNEAMILYVLALGSPTRPAGAEAWEAWVSGYASQWRTEYGYTYLTFPPLFGHQYSHVWIDFRGMQDEYMRGRGIDYFENSRRATLAQRAYHIANPNGYPNYGRSEWGLTASDTPDGYAARGAPPPQNDDGTLVPTAPGGSIVFTPDESIAALRTMYDRYRDRLWGPYGFRDAYNVSRDWFDDDYLGIDQGPILLMIENHRSEAIWDAMMDVAAVQRGLSAAGFSRTGVGSDRVHDYRMPAVDLYPNPSIETAELEVVLPAPGRVKTSIVDLLGRRVAAVDDRHRGRGLHRISIDVSDLSSGMYFVLVESDAGVAARPMHVIR